MLFSIVYIRTILQFHIELVVSLVIRWTETNDDLFFYWLAPAAAPKVVSLPSEAPKVVKLPEAPKPAGNLQNSYLHIEKNYLITFYIYSLL